MSQRALLLSCRDVLQASKTASPPALVGLGLPQAQCDVLFDGQPPPGCGELFVALHPGEWTTEDIEGLNEVFGLDITVTVRVGVLPRDRMAPTSILASLAGESLDQQLEAIRALLHLDSVRDQWLNQANTYIGGTANGFVEPPRFRGGDRPQACGPDWFGTDWDGQGPLPPVGISQTLHFGGARRLQRIESED